MRGLAIIILLLACLTLDAQHYRFRQYRVEQGLPSDVIKSVTEDSLGYIWIATDDGLVKYDGARFTTYKQALRSQFAKGFLHTSTGRLLAFSDLDLVEIQNAVDTVTFKPILRGERYLSDSTISYPKSIYQDKANNIWLGEPRSVVRYDGEKVNRFDFGESNRTSVFVRSFSFFEDDVSNLYVVSYHGTVFRYDARAEKFDEIAVAFPREVSGVLYHDGRVYIAARAGLFVGEVRSGNISRPINEFPVEGVSDLKLTRDSSIIVSTYGPDLYRIRYGRDLEWEEFQYNFNGVNNSYESKEGDIWVSTDKGLVVVQTNTFALADLNSQTHFIVGMASDPDKNMYYASKETLVKLSPRDEDWERRVMMQDKSNYFQSLEWSPAGLWAATSWRVILFNDEKIVKAFDFSDEGNFVHHLYLASDSNLWLSQGGNQRIIRIEKDFTVRSFPVENIGHSEINHIGEAEGGIYALANGEGSYIFLKAHGDSVFRNVSPPLSFEVRGDFNVNNMAVQGDVIWLATSEGLLKLNNGKLERQNRGQDFERFPVSCVKVLDDRQVLFSNSFGLFRYDVPTGEYWLYDEDSGLPSNTITEQGIFVSDRRVWVGTSYGIATTLHELIEPRLTRSPYCVEARVNGLPKKYARGVSAGFGSYITLQFSSISFPENKIGYQWKLAGDADWQPLPGGLLSLMDLPAGEHTIHVRAKKNTGFSWSTPTSLTVRIDSPYWQKAEFFFLVILVIVLIAWASYGISSAILSHRRQYLEEQINERTQELKKANEELTIRNTELDRFVYSASHDLSAPLKSILGLIRVAKLDKPEPVQQQYLDMMERSVFKLEDFIEEVVTYSRNTRMPVKLERLEFNQFVSNILQDHQYSPNYQHIDFRIKDETGQEMISDVTRLKIVLNNLISNAIKFHWLDSGQKPFVEIRLSQENQEYILSVSDNGRGIPEEHLKKIFEMFYRASDDAQGSGLGLYILKEAVLKLGGSVEARSERNKGAEFIIRLPVPQT